MSRPAVQCLRCGTCCMKGGPALHDEDRALLERGAIQREMLWTLRRGEPVHDNVAGTLITLREEIVKIRGGEQGWTCVLFDERNRSCRIYDQRPLECRALSCRDHREIRRTYARQRLSRRDVIRSPSALWELIETHEEQCSVEVMGSLAHRILGSGDKGDAEAVALLGEMIRKDGAFRELLSTRAGAGAELLEFLLGRRLDRILPLFGLRAEQRKGAMTLIRDRAYLDEAIRVQRRPSSRSTKVP
jgi:Fe-S-cluster containining protein